MVAFVVLLVILLVLVPVVILVVGWWQSSSGGYVPLWSILAPFCSLFVIVIVLLIAAAAGAFRSRPSLPPPPPIQQPMVPAGMQGPIALNCPNCGAPPGVVDRFGVATCTHCSARFLVR